MIFLFISLVAGLLTILAPCTLALLPVIVGGSLSGEPSFRRALIVTSSLGVSVIAFTYLLKVSSVFINVPQSFWQIVSGGIIFLIGITMIVPSVWENIPFMNALNRDSNKVLAQGYQRNTIWGDILIGIALGPVFSSCSPTYFLILATVLPTSFAVGTIYLFVYTIGLCGGLLAIAFAGQTVLKKLGVASDPNGWIKRTIGILFVVIGILIIFGLNTQLELALQNSGYFDVTNVEQYLLQKNAGSIGSQVKGNNASITASSTDIILNTAARLAMESAMYQKAPEITDPSGFINTNGQPITIGQFKGKDVVLIDFWTYSCINCQRELPYIEAWSQKYDSEGLIVIGIHTPEFSFEKVQANVAAAVKSLGITYPVVMDNDYGTWNAFGNEYWPRTYLINIDGYIVYNHIGEGDYTQTEEAIQEALKERAAILATTTQISTTITVPANVVSVDTSQPISPETYFDAARNEFLGNGNQYTLGIQNFILPQQTSLSTLYLGGPWNIESEYAQSQATGTQILYTYYAKNLYFVAGSANAAGTTIAITLDGKPLSTMAGSDVGTSSTALIQGDRLYHLVAGTDYGMHTIEITSESPGLQAYTFTFG